MPTVRRRRLLVLRFVVALQGRWPRLRGKVRKLTLKLGAPTRVDTVILREDIAEGERVREFHVDGLAEGEWRKIGEGTAIGNKRIQPLEPALVDAVRIVTTRSVGKPIFRNVAVYNAGNSPPDDWNAVPQIWAANLVGHWSDHAFSIDLTSRIDAAKQYRLRFVPRAGVVTGISGVVLKLDDAAEPNFVKPANGKVNELILDITGIAEKVRVSGQVQGASSGDIVLQKL